MYSSSVLMFGLITVRGVFVFVLVLLCMCRVLGSWILSWLGLMVALAGSVIDARLPCCFNFTALVINSTSLDSVRALGKGDGKFTSKKSVLALDGNSNELSFSFLLSSAVAVAVAVMSMLSIASAFNTKESYVLAVVSVVVAFEACSLSLSLLKGDIETSVDTCAEAEEDRRLSSKGITSSCFLSLLSCVLFMLSIGMVVLVVVVCLSLSVSMRFVSNICTLWLRCLGPPLDGDGEVGVLRCFRLLDEGRVEVEGNFISNGREDEEEDE